MDIAFSPANCASTFAAGCASIAGEVRINRMSSFKRGMSYHCASGCETAPSVSVLVLVMTPGGRANRKQSNTGTQRLCDKCARELKGGKIPKELKKRIANSLWECGIEDK